MKQIFKRILLILPAVTLQVLWYWLLVTWLAPWSPAISLILRVASLVVILYISTKEDDSTYKILWLLVILNFPILGTFLYLIVGNKRPGRRLQKKLVTAKKGAAAISGGSDLDAMPNGRLRQTFRYMENITGFPVKRNEWAKYYPLGEDMFDDLLEELQKAERFIFLEYFIVQRGCMWNSIVAILEQKVKEGVDVRVLYDDLGSLQTYAIQEARSLERKGIRCRAFNPIRMVSGTLNYRDHRKMTVIDGKVVFSGGVNLSDEYINRIRRFGHWKDIAFCLKGRAVANYTRMFVEFWNAFAGDKIPTALYKDVSFDPPEEGDGLVLSYCDSPIKRENASNDLYIELLGQARHSAYFYTPYLLLGNSLLEAFRRTAKRGVDVRIIMPGVPDKPLVFRMSRSYYLPLLESGVKIYEYLPGFVHAKGCIIDGEVGTIGTVNLDYRSLFLHFENNSLFYQSEILSDLTADYLATQSRCREMKRGVNVKESLSKWLVDGILRVFAPLC